MAGATRGPAPKRQAERNRRNALEGPPVQELTPDQLASLPFKVELLVAPPEGDKDWHDAAKMMYSALLRDPARIWMGPASWALSWLMCETISRELKPQVVGIIEGGYDEDTHEKIAGHVAREVVPIKGQTITAMLKWAAAIGINESDRLAMRKEVTFNNVAPTQYDASDEEVAETREGFFVVEGGQA